MSDEKVFKRIVEQFISPPIRTAKYNDNWTSIAISREVLERLEALKMGAGDSYDAVLRRQLDLDPVSFTRESKYGFNRLVGNYYTVLRIPINFGDEAERKRIYAAAKNYASRHGITFLVQFFEGHAEIRHLNK